MSALAQPLLDWAGELGLVAFTVFLRIGACLAFLPAFGEQTVPARVRLGLAFAFCALVLPLVAPLLLPKVASNWTWGFAVAEILNGLVLGFVFRLLVMALNIAGMIAASATSLAQIFGGGVGVDPQPAIGNAMVVAGIALATLGGLHVKVVEAMLLSYTILPAGIWPLANDLAEWAMRDVARAFALGFALAAPFTVAAFIYNLALGVINRAMPQLMVAFVGAPALTLGGLLLMALSLPFALESWMAVMDATLRDPFGAGH